MLKEIEILTLDPPKPENGVQRAREIRYPPLKIHNKKQPGRSLVLAGG
jgi:hypothetical protein